MKPALFFACLLLLVSTCYATELKDVDGNLLLESCNSAVQFMDNGAFSSGTQSSQSTWCLGYVTGVLQSLDFVGKSAGKEGRKLYPCLAGVTSAQAVRVIVKYLKENPEKLQERAVMLSLAALQRAFPCK
ncbi:MAG: Rap1a/Tai family immunity protein [Terriglobales bacterium]